MAVTNSWPDKAPADTLDYSIDWTEVLNGDTITGTPTWTCSDPALVLTLPNVTNAAITSIYLSGGVVETSYTVFCQIATVGGRTIKRGVNILVTDR